MRRRIGDILGRIGAVLEAPERRCTNRNGSARELEPDAPPGRRRRIVVREVVRMGPRVDEGARESEKPPEPEGSSGLSRRTIRRRREACQIERARRADAQPMTSSTGR